MEFAERIKQLSERVNSLKSQIKTEEATKTSFIMPFFQALGYDVFNPMEFLPEYTADVGIKKGERVDYAIFSNNEPIMLIEAKWCGEPLDKHGNQLCRYFAATPTRFGILTNGVEYRFYTDLEEPNKMDTRPFFVFDLNCYFDQDINELEKFQKTMFDSQAIIGVAENLKYVKSIKDLLERNLQEPEAKFINYVLDEVYKGNKTQQIKERFKPMIKKALGQFANGE